MSFKKAPASRILFYRTATDGEYIARPAAGGESFKQDSFSKQRKLERFLRFGCYNKY